MVDTLKIVDMVLAPKPEIKMKFTCKNPFKIYGPMEKMLMEVMKVTGKDVFTHCTKWDDSAANREFFAHWHVQDEFDNWSMKRVDIKIQGVQHAETKNGWIEIRIKGQIISEFDYSNPLKKFFFELYNRVFYSRQRREYIDDANDDIKEIWERIREAYKIPQKEE